MCIYFTKLWVKNQNYKDLSINKDYLNQISCFLTKFSHVDLSMLLGKHFLEFVIKNKY